MTRGMKAFEDKERRAQRRRNHIAKDLRRPQFRQQKIDGIKRWSEKYLDTNENDVE